MNAFLLAVLLLASLGSIAGAQTEIVRPVSRATGQHGFTIETTRFGPGFEGFEGTAIVRGGRLPDAPAPGAAAPTPAPAMPGVRAVAPVEVEPVRPVEIGPVGEGQRSRPLPVVRRGLGAPSEATPTGIPELPAMPPGARVIRIR